MSEPSTVERLKLLAARPVLNGLDPAVLQDVDAALESVDVPGGAHLVERGETGAPLFLVVQGGVRSSFVGPDGRRHVAFEYFRGSSVGEALLLSGRPAPLDLHAIRDSHLLLLSRARFDELTARHPELMLNFARFVAARVVELVGSPDFLASFCHKADRLPRSIALLAVGGEEVHRVRGQLADALSRFRTTTRLTAPQARKAIEGRAEMGTEGAYGRLIEWVDALDVPGDSLIFECELSDASWLDFCLRQADRIMVLLDDAESPPTAKGIDWWSGAKLGERSAHLELAVVHRQSSHPPHGSSAYAQLPNVARLHHVRARDTGDAQRLARWLLDRPVGLVLGGGGAYGIAHVGVLKALEEAHVPVDTIGGTSMGAIFAGGLARGWDADRIMGEVRALFASRFALYDPTIPFKSLLAGKKLDRVLEGLFEDLAIADLWIPFFCVATNIVRAQSQVHDSGSLRDAIRSSCSIPGLFPPYQMLKDLFVDGGLVDNLPIDVMAERCRGSVIAVDVFPYQRHGRELAPGGLARLLNRLKSPTDGLPLFDTLMHATLTGSQRTTEMSRANHPPALYLTPRLDKFGILEWRSYEAMFREGYECAAREIAGGGFPRSLWEGGLEKAAPSQH